MLDRVGPERDAQVRQEFPSRGGISRGVNLAKGSAMDQVQGLSFGRKLILGGGVLLLISTFLNWQSIEVFGQDFGRNAWHGFWGVVLGLMTIALIVWVLGRAFNMQLPSGQPEALIALVLGVLILIFAVIKVLTDDAVHWPAYVGILLAAVIAYGAWLNFQASSDELPGQTRATMTAGAGPEPTAPPTPTAPTPTDRAETPPPADDV